MLPAERVSDLLAVLDREPIRKVVATRGTSCREAFFKQREHRATAMRSAPSSSRSLAVYAVSLSACLFASTVHAFEEDRAMSGVRAWVDANTPSDALDYTSSRGDKWELVMSDEFDVRNRSFLPGDDHLWTAIDAPDGTATGLGYYAKELASTECQDGVGCYLKLQAITKSRTLSVWNPNASPPGMQAVTFNYQSAMLQSWNKFCFQGGMIEIRAKLPGAVTASAKNPDVANGPTARVKTAGFYPTWPGVWLMGNLGRALFRESMDRIWPFSYDKCESDVFDPKNQRISACNAAPGSGMNANQGRGAPQIDIFQGGGIKIASSLIISPGMPSEFRRIAGENTTCAYTGDCKTQGANVVGVPTTAYASRNHNSWYQGLRYAFNPLCANDDRQGRQSYDSIQASLKAGVFANTCDLNNCPASFDINSDLSLIGTSSTYGARWGINTDGSCFTQMSPYDGGFTCDVSSRDADCVKPVRSAQAPSQNATQTSFKYRTDTLSANWPAHLAMFTEFMTYQVEWVPGDEGYIRWMLDEHPIYEIAADAVMNPPQDDRKSNPTKILPEEPMYLILNLALSSTSSSEPPLLGSSCESQSNRPSGSVRPNATVCDQFPLDLKIDYIRVYQDVSSSSSMNVGCDPASHPTKQWIQDHIREYQDAANPVKPVIGRAFCSVDEDCGPAGQATGSCIQGRCVCSDAEWMGPRCTTSSTSSTARNPRATDKPADEQSTSGGGGGPEITLSVAGGVVLVMLFVIIAVGRQVQRCTLFRKMTPVNHNIRAMTLEPESAESVRSYQLTPTTDVPTNYSKGDYFAADTPSTEDDTDKPNFVIQL